MGVACGHLKASGPGWQRGWAAPGAWQMRLHVHRFMTPEIAGAFAPAGLRIPGPRLPLPLPRQTPSRPTFLAIVYVGRGCSRTSVLSHCVCRGRGGWDVLGREGVGAATAQIRWYDHPLGGRGWEPPRPKSDGMITPPAASCLPLVRAESEPGCLRHPFISRLNARSKIG